MRTAAFNLLLWERFALAAFTKPFWESARSWDFHGYPKGVVSGEIPACRYVRLACQRHLADLERAKSSDCWFEFDEGKAARVLNFVSALRHYKGKSFAGKFFEPEPWQVFFYASAFGWVRKRSGMRRFREVTLIVPRKNGKSFVASSSALFLLVADSEPAAEIYCCATKLDQAKIVWEAAEALMKGNPELVALVDSKYTTLVSEDGSKVAPLGKDSKTLDGLAPSGAINDETHAWPDRSVYDVVRQGMKSRDEPLILNLSTEGYLPDGFFEGMRDGLISVIEGDIEDDEFFGLYYTLDDGEILEGELKREAWRAPETWALANPNLGVSVKVDGIESALLHGQREPSALVDLKVKQFNIRVEGGGGDSWVSVPDYDACNHSGDLGTFAGWGGRTSLGIDLSSKLDLTSMVLVFENPSGGFGFFPRFYLPEVSSRFRNKKWKVDFQAWVDGGWIALTPGEVVDMDFVKRDLFGYLERFSCESVCLDPWRAAEFLQVLGSRGYGEITREFPQTYSNFTPPMMEFESLLAAGKIATDGNPVFRWNCRNAIVKRSADGGLKVDKSSNFRKIDGLVAALMGLAPLLTESVQPGVIIC